MKALSLVAVLLVSCAASQRPTALSPTLSVTGAHPAGRAWLNQRDGSREACHSHASEKPFGSEMEEVGDVLQQVDEHR